MCTTAAVNGCLMDWITRCLYCKSSRPRLSFCGLTVPHCLLYVAPPDQYPDCGSQFILVAEVLPTSQSATMARPLPTLHTTPNAHVRPINTPCIQWRVLPSLAALPPRCPTAPPQRGMALRSNNPDQPLAFTPGDLPTQGDAIVGGGLGDEVDAPVSVLVKERSRDVDYLAVRGGCMVCPHLCWTHMLIVLDTHADAGTDCHPAKWSQGDWLLRHPQHGVFASTAH